MWKFGLVVEKSYMEFSFVFCSQPFDCCPIGTHHIVEGSAPLTFLPKKFEWS